MNLPWVWVMEPGVSDVSGGFDDEESLTRCVFAVLTRTMRLIVLFLLVLAGCNPGSIGKSPVDEGDADSLCVGVTCSGHGTCMVTGTPPAASCVCDADHHPDGLGCVPDGGDPCADGALVWRSANKTNYESYPAPNSRECTEYNGCAYLGQFAFCSNPNDSDGAYSEAWVEAHNIVAVFPQVVGGLDLARHTLCLRSGTSTIVVTAIDTCGDGDCGGCCTENRGSADRLIDIEKYTNLRWGISDRPIEWADLGPNPDACTP